MKRKRWWRKAPLPSSPSGGEPLTPHKVDFGFRIYWTKMTLAWPPERCAEVYERLQTLFAQADFDPQTSAKQYAFPLDGIPEIQHNAASLLALAEVLKALNRLASD